MAELTGRAHGYSKGKGGSMHMFSRREGFLRRPRHRRRAGAARHRARLRQPLSRQRQCLPHLFRRRRRQPGPGLRELQHGGAVEAAGRLRHREQPLRHGHGDHALLGGDRTLSRRGLSFNIPGEQVDGMDVRAVKAAGEKAVDMVPRRQGPLHSRDADLPLSRPLDVGPGQVPHARGGREGAHRARSDRAGARTASWRRKWRTRTS